MTYLLLKAGHVAAVLVWIGGMLAAALAPVPRWDRLVTTPAMLLAFAFGLALATTGGWFPQAWLIGKLAVVLALAALHGVLSGRLRRGLAPPRYAAPLIVVAAAVIALLAVVKP
jgi:uncharacterized membrane protein